MVERWVLDAVPIMSEGTITAREVTEKVPHLSRSTIDRALKKLASYEVMAFESANDSGTPRGYSRYIEGSLL